MRRLPLYGTLGPFTWRLLAVVLVGQGIAIFLGATLARGLADASGGTSPTTLLWLGACLALLSIIAAGLMRRPYGVTAGWVVQVLTWLGALILPAMIGVGIIFTGLWLLLMVQGQRAERVVAERDAAGPTDEDDPGPGPR